MPPQPSIYDFEVVTIDGHNKNLTEYKGKILLIVNLASKCGFTSQYKGLQALHERFNDRGLEILGFPCNQFGGQEPGSEQEIKEFCDLNYTVKFPLFSKIEVNGEGAHPLFSYLKSKAKGVLGTEAIKWNFTKFLVSRNGQVIDRFAPTTSPQSLATTIDSLLNQLNRSTE